MTEARRDELDAIDPGWCPAWDTGWQRCYRLVQNHVQGEDLGRWLNAQRFGWVQLLPVQQWLLENTLTITPAQEDERPVKQTQDIKWAVHLAAARQFHAREGHASTPQTRRAGWDGSGLGGPLERCCRDCGGQARDVARQRPQARREAC
ncbi:hypothetical protein [Streptomyces sp. Wh19]|uniref:hypothetical protein n=1 Tax=Streptomyces sp. Wh19 TaxID=3076629 RepID=UPI0029586557|nr:hypothetical protein [Streptomyces sp. Wh19]